MNALEQLCMDKADELLVVTEAFITQFNDRDDVKLLGTIRLMVAEYKTNRNLLGVLRKAIPSLS